MAPERGVSANFHELRRSRNQGDVDLDDDALYLARIGKQQVLKACIFFLTTSLREGDQCLQSIEEFWVYEYGRIGVYFDEYLERSSCVS